MFLVDKPYISDILKTTIKSCNIPVVGTEVAHQLDLYKGTKIISEEQAIEYVHQEENPQLYLTSENAINWIAQNLSSASLPEKINLFKDKLKFRELISPLFPDFYFKGVEIDELKQLDFDTIPTPFIIKPSVGFFSMGVYKVTNLNEWIRAIESISDEIEQVKNLYPLEVLDTRSFIIEECIEGDEYAVDAYFNSTGEPVTLGIHKHTFASEHDVSDRVYTTSKEIIENNLEDFTEFIAQIGQLADVKNFPIHLEIRRGMDGTILPIEVNPMRFGGWCSTADTTFLSYGFNPYDYYFSQKKPDWAEILTGKEGKLFSIIVLDNSTGVDGKKITAFDYDQLMEKFKKPMELRKIDYKSYPVFGFLITETRTDNFAELKYILDSNLTEFISTH
jgi:ATP-grasp domain